MNPDARRDVWIEAGLAEMARHGIDGVRVEVLAKTSASPRAVFTGASRTAPRCSTAS
jgi:hypothetical protein